MRSGCSEHSTDQAVRSPASLLTEDRRHHQWLPDRLSVERFGFSADSLAALRAMGHTVSEAGGQGVAEVIVLNPKDNLLEGGVDRRAPDGGAAGK